MSAVPKLNLGITGYDDLFKDGKELMESKLPKIHEIPIDQIDDLGGIRSSRDHGPQRSHRQQKPVGKAPC